MDEKIQILPNPMARGGLSMLIAYKLSHRSYVLASCCQVAQNEKFLAGPRTALTGLSPHAERLNLSFDLVLQRSHIGQKDQFDQAPEEIQERVGI